MGKRRKWSAYWLPPEGFGAFFLSSSDDEFKRKHPFGYFLAAALGIGVLIAPMVVYGLVTGSETMSAAGIMGTFIIGIGLFNFVAIILNQYLGHLVSIVSFLLGGTLVALDWGLFS